MATEPKPAKPKKDNWLTRFLGRLAEVNEKQFQGQVPDCCAGKQQGFKPNASSAQHKH